MILLLFSKPTCFIVNCKMKYTELLEEAKKYLPDDYAPIRDNFLSTQKVASIIESQFGVFGKGDPQKNNLLGSVPYLDKIRCDHIVNTFLFGVFLYENSIVIKNQIDYSIKKYETADFRKNFSFFWFLICLFHDLGYAEENKGKKSDVSSNNLEMIGSLRDVDGVPSFFKEVYPLYFIYRKLEFGVTDHGINAGCKMFPNLCNIREDHARNNSDPKFWRKELIPIYNMTSWVVLVHNMWFTTDVKLRDCEIYRKYGLEKLILETKSEKIKQKQTNVIVDYPIKIEEYPVLLLVCLV